MNEAAKKNYGPYDEAFKRAAVEQWMSGVPAPQVAAGLGISAQSLRDWKKQLFGKEAKAEPQSVAELQAEVRRLKAQLQSVTNQRDILKKTIGIFTAPNGNAS